jgi:hypothetical protein
LIAQGRVIQTKPGNVPQYKRYLDEMPGVSLQDLWVDISPLSPQSRERLGYPTQKPQDLLERIISASSNPDAEFQVKGEPESVQAARYLAEDDRFQFEWWALSLVRARPSGASKGSRRGKKGADKGIDGGITFIDHCCQPITNQMRPQGPFFSNRAAWRAEICSTMPRFIASSATSRPVQCVIGRPDFSGLSQAICWIWHFWSGVIRAGAPGRGKSSSLSSMLKSSNAIGCKSIHLCRHNRDISLDIPISRTIRLLLLPSPAANTTRALLAICWLTLCRLINLFRPFFSSFVSRTSTGLRPRIISPLCSNFKPVAYPFLFDRSICGRIYAAVH